MIFWSRVYFSGRVLHLVHWINSINSGSVAGASISCVTGVHMSGTSAESEKVRKILIIFCNYAKLCGNEG